MGVLISKNITTTSYVKQVSITFQKEPSKWEQYQKKKKGYIPILNR